MTIKLVIRRNPTCNSARITEMHSNYYGRQKRST
jgi:hypothetical protein